MTVLIEHFYLLLQDIGQKVRGLAPPSRLPMDDLNKHNPPNEHKRKVMSNSCWTTKDLAIVLFSTTNLHHIAKTALVGGHNHAHVK